MKIYYNPLSYYNIMLKTQDSTALSRYVDSISNQLNSVDTYEFDLYLDNRGFASSGVNAYYLTSNKQYEYLSLENIPSGFREGSSSSLIFSYEQGNYQINNIKNIYDMGNAFVIQTTSSDELELILILVSKNFLRDIQIGSSNGSSCT